MKDKTVELIIKEIKNVFDNVIDNIPKVLDLSNRVFDGIKVSAGPLVQSSMSKSDLKVIKNKVEGLNYISENLI